jgi:CHAD domain-containing protein
VVARGYRLGSHAPLEAQARQVGVACVDQALAALEDPREVTVHDARKRLKEARALLTLLRSAVPPEARDHCMGALRDAGRHLAHAREAAVRLRCFDALLSGAHLPVDRRELTALRTHLVDAHFQAESEAVRAGGVAGARDRLGVARRAFATLTLEREGWSSLAPGLRRQYARARRVLRTAADTPTTEAFHTWRQQSKRHQYHLELLAGVASGGLGKRLRKLRELNEILGDDHDLADLQDHLQQHLGGSHPAAVTLVCSLAAARSTALRREAVTRGLELFRPRPKALTRRVRQRVASRLGAAGPGLHKAGAASVGSPSAKLAGRG